MGYLRDVRRMTVALSRARLGLYILGRREIFESCFELRQAFELLLKRPDKLVLATGEMWPSKRVSANEDEPEVPGEAVMEGLQHLGEFVYQMTKTKMEQLQKEKGAAALVQPAEDEAAEEEGAYVENGAEDEEDGAEEDGDDVDDDEDGETEDKNTDEDS